jgi:hypothetical protein
MGRKHIIKDFPVFTAQAVSASGSFDSLVTDVEQVDRVTYSMRWSGTPVGLVEIQVSNNEEIWQTLEFGQQIQVNSGDTNHRIEINQVNFKFCKMVYNHISGSGTIDASIHGATEGA